MSKINSNYSSLSQEQEASLVAFVEKDLKKRAVNTATDTHLLAWVAVRAMNRRGWLVQPEEEVVPFEFEVETGSGVRI